MIQTQNNCAETHLGGGDTSAFLVPSAAVARALSSTKSCALIGTNCATILASGNRGCNGYQGAVAPRYYDNKKYSCKVIQMHISATRKENTSCPKLFCPSIFKKWPIKIDFVLTNGLPNFRPYFVLC